MNETIIGYNIEDIENSKILKDYEGNDISVIVQNLNFNSNSANTS